MPVQPRGKSAYANANGLRHRYLEYGNSGPCMVIVPGITSPAITWEFVSEELAPFYHVYTLDVRGRGDSDTAPSGGYLVETYAADVAGLVEALGIKRPIIVGHSMGARIVTAVGALYPEVRGPLIVMDPPLCGPGRPPYPSPLQPYVDSLRKAKAGATADDMRPSFPTWTDEQLQLRAEALATCDETAVVESYRNFHEEDFFAYWRKVQSPVLFMYGGISPVVSEGALAEVKEANPGAEVACIPNAAHMIPWDNMHDFVAETRAFLDRAAVSR